MKKGRIRLVIGTAALSLAVSAASPQLSADVVSARPQLSADVVSASPQLSANVASAEVRAADLSGIGSGISDMFTMGALENTWLFAGGVETQGRFAELGDMRGFVGHFEEYIRFKQQGGSNLGKQRYMINAGKEGMDISELDRRFEDIVRETNPRAVVYLIGREDYSRGEPGLADFRQALDSVIRKSLALKTDTGFAVIQLPHAVKDAGEMEKIRLYADAVREVIGELDESLLGRVVLADHLSQTDNDAFKNNKLDANGLLNADGHYEVAKQLAQCTFGSTANFPALKSFTLVEGPREYPQERPSVTAGMGSLNVTIPESVSGDEWKYTVTIEGTEITGTASGRSFVIGDLPMDRAYELSIRSADGKVQLKRMAGVVTDGDIGEAPKLSPLQQAIRDKAEQKDQPLSWLFMGDSITHACLFTYGYNGVAQLFEKYVKEDLGRMDDLVINTGYSGTDTEDTLKYIAQRLEQYTPDVVFLMLGTNDIGAINANVSADDAPVVSPEDYRSNMETMVDKIRAVNPEALIVFRSPTPANCAKIKRYAPVYGDIMKEIAEADGGILYIDQFTEWDKQMEAYPYLYQNECYYGNFLHPGAEGQAYMFRQLLRESGLDTDTRIANVALQMAYTDMESTVVPEVTKGEGSAEISREALQSAYGSGQLGEFTVTLTDQDTGRSYAVQAGFGENVVFRNLPTDRTYKVQASALIKGNAAQRAVFGEQEITLEKSGETRKQQSEINGLVRQYQSLYQEGFTKYTKETWQSFSRAYRTALYLAEAQVVEPEKLASCLEALENAAAGLKQKPVTKPEDPQGGNSEEPPHEEQKKLTVGDIRVVKGYIYRVTSTAARKVTCTGIKNRKAKKLTIPDTVTLEGKSWKVTGIFAGAFKNCKKATAASVGKQITSIGAKAFQGCRKLSRITIKSKSLKKVGKGVFKGIAKKGTIKVPSAKLKNYKRLLAGKGQKKTVRIIK